MAFESPEEMEEERRLFYVAITRAKKRVLISYAQNRYRWGVPTSCRPSRFLRDIDQKYLELPVEQTSRVKSHYDDEDDDRDDPFKKGFITARSTSKTGLLIPKKPVMQPKQASPEFKPDSPDSIQSGMRVEHPTFGIGKIIHIEGVSPNRKAAVFFQELGEEKQLLLKFAKLRIVKSDE